MRPFWISLRLDFGKPRWVDQKEFETSLAKMTNEFTRANQEAPVSERPDRHDLEGAITDTVTDEIPRTSKFTVATKEHPGTSK
ncbi:hypothetical protein AAY473_015566, partial [Plecturocebus cupreus]